MKTLKEAAKMRNRREDRVSIGRLASHALAGLSS